MSCALLTASPSTPRPKAARLVHGLKLSPQQSSKVQKELKFSNVVCEKIKPAANKAPQRIFFITLVLAGL